MLDASVVVEGGGNTQGGSAFPVGDALHATSSAKSHAAAPTAAGAATKGNKGRAPDAFTAVGAAAGGDKGRARPRKKKERTPSVSRGVRFS